MSELRTESILCRGSLQFYWRTADCLIRPKRRDLLEVVETSAVGARTKMRGVNFQTACGSGAAIVMWLNQRSPFQRFERRSSGILSLNQSISRPTLGDFAVRSSSNQKPLFLFSGSDNSSQSPVMRLVCKSKLVSRLPSRFTGRSFELDWLR